MWFCPSYHVAGASPLPLDMRYLFLVGSNILLSTVVQQWVIILEFSQEKMETEPKQKQHPVVDMTGDGSKVWCCKYQYCIRTWNLRSTNQGKLEVVKQEMARVNIDILGIRELKWTGMGEFNLMGNDHYIYYCGQESLKRNGVALIVNKRVWNAVLGCDLKNEIFFCSFLRQAIQYHSNPSLCPNQ